MLIADEGSLQAAGAVARLTGAQLLCENAFPRLDRGGGLPHPKRLPYFPQDAARALAAFEVVVAADARRPIAMVRRGVKNQNKTQNTKNPKHPQTQKPKNPKNICGGTSTWVFLATHELFSE